VVIHEKNYKPVALIILDGWGIRENAEGNAVVLGETPNYDRWNQTLERCVLDASGLAVGLPEGQMGNSEVGHLNLGAAASSIRISPASTWRFGMARLPRIPALGGYEKVKATKRQAARHRPVWAGGVHSHSDHMNAILDMANAHGVAPVLHMITDGRDTPPESSGFLTPLEAYGQQKAVIGGLGQRPLLHHGPRPPLAAHGDGLRRDRLHQGHEGRTAVSARAAIAPMPRASPTSSCPAGRHRCGRRM
jgi:bisphosphoglycerate-independent phosphoglycerate mutase (AlkP superfamily)